MSESVEEEENKEDMAAATTRIQQFMLLDPKKTTIFPKVWDVLRGQGWTLRYGKIYKNSSRENYMMPPWSIKKLGKYLSNIYIKVPIFSNYGFVQDRDYFMQGADILSYIKNHNTIDQVGDNACC